MIAFGSGCCGVTVLKSQPEAWSRSDRFRLWLLRQVNPQIAHLGQAGRSDRFRLWLLRPDVIEPGSFGRRVAVIALG